MLGDCTDHTRARGLSRLSLCSGPVPSTIPLSCSGTVPTTLVLGTVSTALVLGDCPDYLCARGLSRLRLFLGIHRFPHAALRDCPDHCLNNGSPWLHVIYTHIQLRDISLDLATRLIPRLPASSGTTSVRCTCRCSSYRLYDDWILNLTVNSF